VNGNDKNVQENDMEIELKQINRQEVLQYLLWRGGEIPDEIDRLIDETIGLVQDKVRPKYIWKRFAVECTDGNVVLPQIGVTIKSGDVNQLLFECKECIWMAVTLGNEMERLIRMAQARNLTQAVILDSCGSAAVEAVCDEVQELVKASCGYAYTTDRVSPGYGDIPLKLQQQMTAVLDTSRQIGLTLTDSLILLPRKSVTAIFGLAECEQKKRFRGCAYCSMFETCNYRKAGKYCGRT
jgi:hypothetical protein